MYQYLFLFISLLLVQAQDWTIIDNYIQEAIKNRAFPGGVLAIGNLTHNNIYLKAYGQLSYRHDLYETAATLDTRYDIASQTKIIGTTMSIMTLYNNKQLNLDDLVSKYIPEFATNQKSNVTITHLLLHCSGLPYDIGALPKTKQQLYSLVYSSKLLFPVCTQTSYSNLGFLTLGEIVRIITNTTVENYYTNLLKIMQLNNTGFNPKADEIWKIAPTEYDSQQRKDIVRGTAHQRVAYFLGGVAGHSGYFSTASDILRFGRLMLNLGKLPNESRIFSEEIIKKFTTKIDGLPFNNKRAYGFDTQCPGTIMKNCYGHDGSTGTMLWVDRDRNITFSLLTNRGHPNVQNSKFDNWKPKFVDVLLSIL